MNLLFLCNDENNLRTFNVFRKKKDDIDFKNKHLVSIGAFCLMSNHFHILITELKENGISKFMQKLTTAYVMYYNKKYNHNGGLFEGKFKAEHVSSDRYLKYLFSYIHLNPIKILQRDWKEEGIKNKKEAINFLKEYKYSSYLDFAGEKRVYGKILNLDAFPAYFPNPKAFLKEVFEWLEYK